MSESEYASLKKCFESGFKGQGRVHLCEELRRWEEERLKAVDLQDGVVRGSERAGRCVHKDAEERVYEGPEMRRVFITY